MCAAAGGGLLVVALTLQEPTPFTGFGNRQPHPFTSCIPAHERDHERFTSVINRDVDSLSIDHVARRAQLRVVNRRIETPLNRDGFPIPPNLKAGEFDERRDGSVSANDSLLVDVAKAISFLDGVSFGPPSFPVGI